MSRVLVPSSVLTGVVTAPASKSYTHRALLAAHLAHRPYRIRNPLDSDDTRATATGITALGSPVTRGATSWQVRPGAIRASRSIRCGASGTTLRLLVGLAAGTPGVTRFTGVHRLGERPLTPLLQTLASHGATVHHPAGSTLPLRIGGPIRAGGYEVEGSESSQFASSLLFVLPTLTGPSSLQVLGSMVSAPYVEATLAVLRAHGARIRARGNGWAIPGPQTLRGTQFAVPGDASSAAYLWVGGAVSGGSVAVRGIPSQWPQADAQILDILRAAGSSVVRRGDTVTVTGRPDRPFDTELTPCPDLYPLVGALAALLPGRSVLRGAPQVVGKESDRRAATIDLIRRLGGRTRLFRDRLEVRGSQHPSAPRGTPWSDHRLVMSAAVASLGTRGPSRLGDPRAVRKSYPGFWSALRALGAPVKGIP